MIAIPPWDLILGKVRFIQRRTARNASFGTGEYVSRTDQNATAVRESYSTLAINIADPWACFVALSSALQLHSMVMSRIALDDLTDEKADLMVSHVEVFITTLAEFMPPELP